MTTKVLFLLAIVATMAILPPAFAVEGNRGNPCSDETSEDKIKCRVDMVLDRISRMEDRHSINNDDKTPQDILDYQVIQKDRANDILKLLKLPQTTEIKEEIKEIVFYLGIGCDKLHKMWQEFRQSS